MSEKRLIDANALSERLKDLDDWCGDLRKPGIEQARCMVHEAPAIDAVEVVRCCDCRNGRVDRVNHGYGAPYRVDCRALNRMMYDHDFCSYGERKEAADAV